MSVVPGNVRTMNTYADNQDFFQTQEEAMQKEEDMKKRCPSSGENEGRMIERPGSDDWYIKCPTCGTQWAGGSTVLSEHNKPGF